MRGAHYTLQLDQGAITFGFHRESRSCARQLAEEDLPALRDRQGLECDRAGFSAVGAKVETYCIEPAGLDLFDFDT